MVLVRKINPVARAIMVIASVAALVTGVTFAALSSQATLTQSTIASATAGLLLWDGNSFESTAPGFNVTNLVPGEGSGELPFYFKNTGGVNLNVTAHVPALPTSSGFTGWDNLEVTITSNEPGCAINTVVTDMAALNAGEVALPCNPLMAGAQGNAGIPATEGNYTIEFDIEPSSVSGNQVTVGAFDIVFTGTQATP